MLPAKSTCLPRTDRCLGTPCDTYTFSWYLIIFPKRQHGVHKFIVSVLFCRNNIEELSQVEFLAICGTLTHLTLEGNPLCTTPSPDEASVSFPRSLM